MTVCVSLVRQLKLFIYKDWLSKQQVLMMNILNVYKIILTPASWSLGFFRIKHDMSEYRLDWFEQYTTV